MTIYGDPPAGSLDGLVVSVFGLGKMGLPLAAVLADNGAQVRGVDIDRSVVEAVNAGKSPIENEPGLPSLLERHGGDRLTATTDGPSATTAADVHVLLVPTVVDEDHEPVMDPVLAAASDVAAGVDAGDLVILESTVPPGTTAGTLADAVTPTDREITPVEDFGLAHCPERTYAGRVIQDITTAYPKIVGGIDESSTTAAAAIYEVFTEPGVIEVSSARAAEAVKVFEGVYRDVNIGLANELALACEGWGLDSGEIFEAANSQPFCDIHEPGIGVGGHCIPVYPHFVIDRADRTPLLEVARRVNDGMPDHAVGLLQGLLAPNDRSLDAARVLVLGVAYRPGVDEIRYAPAVALIGQLNAEGAAVYAHDPLVDDADIEDTGATPVDSPLEPADLDGVVLATGHDAYANLDLEALAAGMRTPAFVDGRAFYDRAALSHFDAVTIGDGSDRPANTRRASPQ